MRFLKIIIFLIFIVYWGITFLYNSPDNLIKIENKEILDKFGIVCSQRWSFFAPPPTNNNRLYYEYYNDKKEKIKSYEILQKLCQEKKEKNPFNSQEDILDYTLNGCIIFINEYFRQLGVKNNFNKLYKSDTLKIKQENLDFIKNTGYFRILLTNASQLSKKGNFNAKSVSITITNIPIKKFINRNNQKSEKETVIVSFIENKL